MLYIGLSLTVSSLDGLQAQATPTTDLSALSRNTVPEPMRKVADDLVDILKASREGLYHDLNTNELLKNYNKYKLPIFVLTFAKLDYESAYPNLNNPDSVENAIQSFVDKLKLQNKNLFDFFAWKGIGDEANIRIYQNLLLLASEKGDNEIVKSILKSHLTSQQASEEILQSNRTSKTALIQAMTHNNEKTVALFLKYFTPEQVVTPMAVYDPDYNAAIDPLVLAAKNGDRKYVKMFLAVLYERPELANKMYGYNTALMFAAKEGHLEVVKSLLKILAPGQIGLTNLIGFPIPYTARGMSALMYAAEAGHLEIVKVLLERLTCEQVEKRNAYHSGGSIGGRTALEYAKDNNHPEVAKLIREKLNNECAQ